ncbi:MAG: 50S ribosomal protein L21 [Bacteroidales bacterium]|nr:50S ribosomal protein L21 [Bacteroidales bacterium]
MYAIVDIAGQQIKVEKGQEVFVNRLESKEGSKVNFENVLLIDNNGKVSVGKPIIKGATVSAKIISHDKGDKVLIFHKKRRKGYQKLNGHRQYLSKVVIEGISEKAAPKAKKAEPKTAPKAEVKVEAKKVAKPKVEAKPKAKAKPKAEAKPKATTTKAAATKKTEPKTEKK